MANTKPYQIDPRIQLLYDNRHKLDAWGAQKAFELSISYHKFKGKFTEKQWKFVQDLLDKALGNNVVSLPDRSVGSDPSRSDPSLRSRAGDVPVPVPAMDIWQVAGFNKFKEMLYKAKKGIRLKVGTYKITLTPGQSRRGANVKLNGEFIGVIRSERFQLRAGDASLMPIVLDGIKEFMRNPQEIAKRYGDTTHECCFCGIELTDERSIKAGYGPICAEHYGLPWGEISSENLNETYGDFDAK